MLYRVPRFHEIVMFVCNRVPKSCEILMFVCNQMAKSREILMYVCLRKDAKQYVMPQSLSVLIVLVNDESR